MGELVEARPSDLLMGAASVFVVSTGGRVERYTHIADRITLFVDEGAGVSAALCPPDELRALGAILRQGLVEVVRGEIGVYGSIVLKPGGTLPRAEPNAGQEVEVTATSRAQGSDIAAKRFDPARIFRTRHQNLTPHVLAALATCPFEIVDGFFGSRAPQTGSRESETMANETHNAPPKESNLEQELMVALGISGEELHRSVDPLGRVVGEIKQLLDYGADSPQGVWRVLKYVAPLWAAYVNGSDHLPDWQRVSDVSTHLFPRSGIREVSVLDLIVNGLMAAAVEGRIADVISVTDQGIKLNDRPGNPASGHPTFLDINVGRILVSVIREIASEGMYPADELNQAIRNTMSQPFPHAGLAHNRLPLSQVHRSVDALCAVVVSASETTST